MKWEAIRDNIEAILKVSGIATALPADLQETICRSVANDIVFEYLIEALKEVKDET